MSPLNQFGWDVLLAVAVAVWFGVTGFVKLLPPRESGRRAIGEPSRSYRWLRVSRGVLEMLGALAALAGVVISLLGLPVIFPGLAVGAILAVLAGWSVIEAVRSPLRAVQLVLGLVGFALAVFYAGFRD